MTEGEKKFLVEEITKRLDKPLDDALKASARVGFDLAMDMVRKKLPNHWVHLTYPSQSEIDQALAKGR